VRCACACMRKAIYSDYVCLVLSCEVMVRLVSGGLRISHY